MDFEVRKNENMHNKKQTIFFIYFIVLNIKTTMYILSLCEMNMVTKIHFNK